MEYNNCIFSITLVFVILTIVQRAVAFPTGSPVSACSDLMPVHIDGELQKGASPYMIILNDTVYGSTAIKGGSLKLWIRRENYKSGPWENYKSGPWENYKSVPWENYESGPWENYKSGPWENYKSEPWENYKSGPWENYKSGPWENYKSEPWENYESGPSRFSITAVGPATKEFMAFMLQARNELGQPSGFFSDFPMASKAMTCYNDGDTLTHTAAFIRQSMDFIWHPPSKNLGKISITGSIAVSKVKYWAVESAAIPGTGKLEVNIVRKSSSGSGNMAHLNSMCLILVTVMGKLLNRF
ncbi:Reelin domain-containing protein 1 [Bulinus truncatus]|nr:Reelin domain-containing protein 1 [Bulinus truncatus]